LLPGIFRSQSRNLPSSFRTLLVWLKTCRRWFFGMYMSQKKDVHTSKVFGRNFMSVTSITIYRASFFVSSDSSSFPSIAITCLPFSPPMIPSPPPPISRMNPSAFTGSSRIHCAFAMYLNSPNSSSAWSCTCFRSFWLFLFLASSPAR